MAGKLYGIGVGPGDSELLTIKALKRIEKSDIIAVPGEIPQETVAYKIVAGIYPQIDEKQLLGIYMPMTKDRKLLQSSHEEGVKKLKEQLDKGKEIAFLTLGDPTIYSTYMYLHKRIEKLGYEVEIISGIPSFCAAAAKLGISIAEKSQQIHVIPASYQIEDAMKLQGTKILMKAGRKLPEVKKKLIEHPGQIYMVENCGMEEEHIYYGAGQMPEDAGYYTLIIVKEEEEEEEEEE